MNCPHCSRSLLERPSGRLECTTCRATFSAAAATDPAPRHPRNKPMASEHRDGILVLDYTKRRGHA
jgi:ribosomal protein L37AE/L43A